MATEFSGQGRICNKCRAGVYDIIRRETDTDYTGKTTVTEVYQCDNAKCRNIWRFVVSRDL